MPVILKTMENIELGLFFFHSLEDFQYYTQLIWLDLFLVFDLHVLCIITFLKAKVLDSPKAPEV